MARTSSRKIKASESSTQIKASMEAIARRRNREGKKGRGGGGKHTLLPL